MRWGRWLRSGTSHCECCSVVQFDRFVCVRAPGLLILRFLFSCVVYYEAIGRCWITWTSMVSTRWHYLKNVHEGCILLIGLSSPVAKGEFFYAGFCLYRQIDFSCDLTQTALFLCTTEKCWYCNDLAFVRRQLLYGLMLMQYFKYLPPSRRSLGQRVWTLCSVTAPSCSHSSASLSSSAKFLGK